MLAFTPLAPGGDQLGNPITISTDADNALHELTIVLDDVVTPGTVTATITTTVDGVLDQTAQYFNFSGIAFTGVNDRDGSIVNRVSISTSYEANLVGQEAAPSDDADVGLSTNWLVFNQFPAGVSLGTTVLVDLFNADELVVTGGVRGGGDSTIAGEFESPTLPENMSAANPGSYANIALLSGVGIVDDPSEDPIVASALTLKSQTNGIVLTQDVFTRFDLSIEAAQDITIAGLVEVREGDVSLVSSSGSIAVLDLMHAMAGSITIDSDCEEVTIERLCAFEDILINAPQGVVVLNELRSETGGATITADAGPMRIRDVFTERDIRTSAAETITLFGLLEATSGEIVATTTSGAILLEGAQLHALDNQIRLDAHSRILQDAPGGLIRVDVIASGRLPGSATASTPVVTVEIAPPAGGGETATAEALILREPAPTEDDPEAVAFSVFDIVLTNRGSGYAINESPVVTIRGLPGAVAVAVGPRWAEHLVAETDVTLAAGENVELTTIVRANVGNVAISSIDGEINLSADGHFIHAVAGTVSIDSSAGGAALNQITAGTGINVSALKAIQLLERQTTATGDISIESSHGEITVGASLAAQQGNLNLVAFDSIGQSSSGGISEITLLAGGSGYTSGATVSIAPPAGGGTAATAVAVVEDGVVVGVTLTNPGSGYALAESPSVRISGNVQSGGQPNTPPIEIGGGAAAAAVGPSGLLSIYAEGDVTITAGSVVTLGSTVRSAIGDVRVTSTNADLALGAGSLWVQADGGSAVLSAPVGFATVNRVTVRDDVLLTAAEDAAVLNSLTVGGQATITSTTGQALISDATVGGDLSISGETGGVLNGEFVIEAGDLRVVSEAGTIVINAGVTVKSGVIVMLAHASVTQSGNSGVTEVRLLSGGSGYTNGANVVIAPPASGGTAATAVAIIEDGVIVGLTLTSPGSGYAVGESPSVTISGAPQPGGLPGTPPTEVGGGAAALAIGPAGVLSIYAEDDVTITAGSVVTLGSTVRSAIGDVRVTSTNADLALGAGSLWVQADGGSAVLSAPVGFAAVNRVTVRDDVSLTAAENVAVLNSLTVGGQAMITSTTGQALISDATVGGDLSILGETGGVLNGEFVIEAGDLRVVSSAGSVQVNASITVKSGGIEMMAGGLITQSSDSGITDLQLLSGGSGYSNGAFVQIAPPAAGGEAARAEASVSQEGVVIGLTITAAGSGYAVGESPQVVIVGGEDQLDQPVGRGAAAAAVGPTGLQNIRADKDIRVLAGQGATLTSVIRSDSGSIFVTSENGDLDLQAGSSLLHSSVGNVSVISESGRLSVQRLFAGGQVEVRGKEEVSASGLVTAETGGIRIEATHASLTTNDLVARGDVEVLGFTNVRMVGLVQSLQGNIRSNSQTGVVNLAAAMVAEAGGVLLNAFQSVVQAVDSGVSRIEVTGGGTGYLAGATVTVAPPAGGGRRATAVANLQSVFNSLGNRTDAFISSITILDPGSGYALGENPIVQISGIGDSGGEGAAALAFGPEQSLSIFSQEDLIVSAGESVLLVNKAESAQGNVDIAAHRGDATTSALVLAEGGDILVTSDAGSASASRLVAGRDVIVSSLQEALVTGEIVASRDARIESLASSLNVNNVRSGNDITVTGSSDVTLQGEAQSDQGSILVESYLGSVTLAVNAKAVLGDVLVRSHSFVVQEGPGVTSARVTQQGLGYTFANVSFSPPASGFGSAATGRAVVTPTQIPGAGTVGVITDIEILFPGNGYEPGEIVSVTITGDGTGASAVATAGATLRQIVAGGNVGINAGNDVSLSSVVRADSGDISIRSIDGGVNAADLLHTLAGDLTINAGNDVSLSSVVRADSGNISIRSIDGGVNTADLVHTLAGDITIQSLAGGITFAELDPGRDLTLESFQPLAINQPLVVTGGSAFLESTGFNVEVDADVIAAEMLSISAKTGIVQVGGTIKATDLLAENHTPTPITLAADNDVDRFSAFNAGNVAFNDANSFRVGLQTAGPMGVEVTGDEVTLTAGDTVRVVAGIDAGELTMTADTVEFATTGGNDNAGGPFRGTFRDMIAISNANTDLTSDHVMVFSEPGYPIGEISVSRSLPVITRAVVIDGETADGGRLGVRGSFGVGTGVWFGAGSSGSSASGLALFGFTTGSALVIETAGNTINDVWFGLRADGSAAPASRVGVNVSGDRALGNVIGSDRVFDPAKANRFAGHTDAAIIVQGGASNNLVAGNLVGGEGLIANRNGIRIDGGSGNRIGTPDQVTPDLTPTPSNRVVGNTHYGIEIRNVRGGTTRVENNVVAGNATKAGSGTHGIGVLNSAFVQIGGVSELSRNQVFGSLGGSGIHLSASNSIRIQGNVIGADGYHLSADGHTNDYDANRPDLGNGMHGIHVFGRSRDVLIDSNRIVDNDRSGVAVASGSSGVILTSNEIGVWVHPVTGNVHAAGNDADGVTITAANGNTVGAGNLIGYNRGSGIMVENSVAAGLATGNRLAGAEVFGNLGHGIHISGSSHQTLGGYSDEGNVIKENGLDGIRVENDPRTRASAGPRGNVVAGNFIGTNANEEIDRSWGNRNGISIMNGVDNVLAGNVVMNNRATGIEIGGGAGNMVGGQIESAGNFVGYNFGDGVFVHDQASTQLQVGVVGTIITNQGAGYAASRTSLIFTAPAAAGGVPARGVAIISASGQVTGIRLTSSGGGYEVGEAVSVTIFDPQATVIATATVMLGQAATGPGGGASVSQVSRGHVVSGNEIEANNGAGIYVKGERTAEIQVGQDFDSRTGRGLGNTISFQGVGVLVEAAQRVSVQGNAYGDNGLPVMMMNGANAIPGAELIAIPDLRSTAWGRGQTRVTGSVVNGGAHQEYWVDVYATPYHDMRYDAAGHGEGHQMRRFLGRTLITTDANGRAAISLTVSESMGLGDHLSVTLTSNRYEDGATVGVWHALQPHDVDRTTSPTTGSPSLTPVSSGNGGSTGSRVPVPPRG